MPARAPLSMDILGKILGGVAISFSRECSQPMSAWQVDSLPLSHLEGLSQFLGVCKYLCLMNLKNYFEKNQQCQVMSLRVKS